MDKVKEDSKKSKVGSRKTKDKPAKDADVKKEKSPKKKYPATRKKVAEDIPSDEVPADTRGRKRAGKPSNEERSKQSSRDEKVALICADWLDDIKKARKEIPLAMKIKNLPNYLKLLVREDEVDDEEDLTLILLADKYLGDQKTFHDAEEQSKREIQEALTGTSETE